MAKIVRLKTDNVMRIRVAEVTPDGSLVVIGGENEQGKTSLMDGVVLRQTLRGVGFDYVVPHF